MPSRTEHKPMTQAHIHNFYKKDQFVSVCANLYKGQKCHTLRVGAREYARRCEEWDAYLAMCRETESYRDFKAMSVAFKFGDKEAMAKILESVKTRCRIEGENEWGDPKFVFKKDAHLPQPTFQNPFIPTNYVVEADQ